MSKRTFARETQNNNAALTIHFRHEADNNKHESITDVYKIDPGEFAVMVETDRRERAAQAGRPVDEIKPRHPQQILDDMARQEEAVFHEAYRGDRGPGARKCSCGAGCATCALALSLGFSSSNCLREDGLPTSSRVWVRIVGVAYPSPTPAPPQHAAGDS